MSRVATVNRKTRETDISISLDLDKAQSGVIDSGNGFFDHMLTAFSAHARIHLQLHCKGDIHVDFHHSAEDIGIVLGQALAKALGDKKGISRFASSYVPMDEALARCCLDISGRSFLSYNATFTDRDVGGFTVDLAEDFFKAFSDHAALTLHIDLLRCRNAHHGLEAIFKACGRALSDAVKADQRWADQPPSTKGIL